MEFCHTGTSHSEINCLLCCVLHRPRRCEPGRRMASGLELLVTLVFQVEGLLAWRSLPFACPWMDFKVSVTFYMDSDRNLCKICVIINVCILRRWLTFSDSSLRIFQILPPFSPFSEWHHAVSKDFRFSLTLSTQPLNQAHSSFLLQWVAVCNKLIISIKD